MSFTARTLLGANARALSRKCFSQCQVKTTASPMRFYATTKQEIRQKAAIGPFTMKAAAVFLTVGGGLLYYFQSEKEKVEKLRIAKEAEKSKTQSFGKPKLGGDYSLTNVHTSKQFGSEDLKGKFSLIYFGFTHCPDICPEELDKMAEVVDQTKKQVGENVLVPIFITCDPRRDTVEIVKEYVKDFHPDLIGLTGTQEEIKRVAKLFRVYVSSPPDISEGDDYLVDHSIFFYLMDPEGKFLDCYSQNSKAEEVTEGFKTYYKEYLENGGTLNKSAIEK
ncbi:SCO1/SenC-domain-containing protein [Mucor mucedo]|uniref:SCO1/SenC-domain-containing protein n=1 Tax=Mucor mucedo TaxID=29922 RepID=UPI0022209F28|nr:SCO1/SenC-domain-containing protein [Mucor mucedo]KAI7890685.1 SCO1/SenC-domain-containing protein [Mucor mucedo]